MATILVAEDEKNMRDIIVEYMRKGGHRCLTAEDGVDALAVLKSQSVDALILDVMMPHLDGLSVCRIARERSGIPIVILTAKGGEEDKLKGYAYGADDYMTKPFSKAVLVSKIRAIIRRTRQYAPAPAADTMPPTTAQIGCFTLHFDSQTVLKDGKEISLSSKEFALLCFFMENPDTLLTKQEIFSKVWKSETPDDNSILVYMKRLRDKIEDTPSKPVHLTTVWGKGYRFNP